MGKHIGQVQLERSPCFQLSDCDTGSARGYYRSLKKSPQAIMFPSYFNCWKWNVTVLVDGSVTLPSKLLIVKCGWDVHIDFLPVFPEFAHSLSFSAILLRDDGSRCINQTTQCINPQVRRDATLFITFSTLSIVVIVLVVFPPLPPLLIKIISIMLVLFLYRFFMCVCIYYDFIIVNCCVVVRYYYYAYDCLKLEACLLTSSPSKQASKLCGGGCG